jgi:hypothetical protein
MSRKEPEPKIAIFPTKFNFRRYETARRISEQEDINTRPNKRVDDLPGLLERYSKKSSGTRGVNKRNVRGTKRIGAFDVNVIAEYTLDDAIDEGILKSMIYNVKFDQNFFITNNYKIS